MSPVKNALAQPTKPPERPLIPEKYFDIPSQRLYALSFGLLIQAIKVFDFIQYLFSSPTSQTSHYGRKWLITDFLYCIVLSQLRIPRINYAKSIVIFQILGLWFLDGLLFGGIQMHLLGDSTASSPINVDRGEIYSTPSEFSWSGLMSMLSFGVFSNVDPGGKDAHLLGQHTVRMSPISTALLNPFEDTFCLSPESSHVLIPVLLNNSNPTSVRYTLTPLGYSEGMEIVPEQLQLSIKELKAIEALHAESMQLSKATAYQQERDDEDYYDEEDLDSDHSDRDPYSLVRLQKTQSLVHIRVTKPGTVHLRNVGDQSGVEARILYPSHVTVAPCPRAQFIDSDPIVRGDNVRCAAPGHGGVSGDDRDIELGLSIYGVPPLSLKWYKEINGKREYFIVEGIEAGHAEINSPTYAPAPQDIKVPLVISADALGTHTYALDAVMDALGNVQLIGSTPSLVSAAGPGTIKPYASDGNSKTNRTLHVLRRPSMSFKGCGPGSPIPLRAGSESKLVISATEADLLDGPWEVSVQYQPPTDNSGKGQRYKPWKRSMQTPEGRKELTFDTNIPGEYTILDVKGKYCEGDVLSPETCTVVEVLKPTAEIEWRRIHECSGDTGVAASLVLHGTPPFRVYYRMQRDKEPPRELVQTFHSSRGEMTLQPPRSGHYIYSFSHISDENYKLVELKGPSIDQIVHPLASANFVNTGSPGREKMYINSCSGETVNIEVELQGTGPWNLDVQLVAPKGSEIIKISGIETARKVLQLPIPTALQQNGGTFEVDLVSIEDSYGCKRPISVPGVVVNVRRIKPTARFYGKDNQRHVTTLEDEEATLPLRLTGDGPWRIKYRTLEDAGRVQTAILQSPNDYLRVRQKGLYEIIEIADSQCPGTVSKDANTYRVDWVPRPSARLSADTTATYEPYNGSYILPPICEGQSGHVDLDLTGRPPFQIMYNIARAGEPGGAKLLDQPTFNSIQPRTRFQLHTSEAGRVFYEVKQVGDTTYPLAKHKGAVIPRSDRPLFEQEVLARPSARFRSPARLQYCLYDTFTPRDKLTTDGLITLEGNPPFQLTLSVKNLASSERHLETITVNEKSWKLNLPNYIFKAIGQHLIMIESVRDASHCEQIIPDPGERSIWADVAESAAIVPFDRREHFCVGDIAQFQLEGIPPWTIGYRVNGKSYTQEVKVSPFSVAQQQPGEFKITSIAHQQKMCKSAVTDLNYTVHPLPSAQVGHGKKIFQDIHEGDQAEIKFTLVGEPPFTFTYQRSEVSSRKSGKPGKVLETHTVSGVTEKEYSILSALEGTWTVTFISDRYCRYPPSQPDGMLDRR